MLKKDCSFYSIIIAFLFLGCIDKKTDPEYEFKKGLVEQICMRNFDSIIYKMANDSIKLWVNNHLKEYIDCATYPWQLDSSMAFNKSKTRLVMALYRRIVSKELSVADDMDYFYGTKLNNKWYFFRGSNYIIPRELYKDTSKMDIHTPFTFRELHSVSLGIIYKDYVKSSKLEKEKDQTSFRINEEFFNQIILSNGSGRGYEDCWSCKTEEEFIIHTVKKNWREKDTTLNLE